MQKFNMHYSMPTAYNFLADFCSIEDFLQVSLIIFCKIVLFKQSIEYLFCSVTKISMQLRKFSMDLFHS